MNYFKFGKVALFFFTISTSVCARDTLRLNREQCEAIFLKDNLILLAEKLNIPQAEALVLQAKLWPNPVFEIDEVNLWATQRQLGVFGDDLQGLNGGNFGKNQQLSIAVEQLILTAGKRKKLIALEELSVNKTMYYFEDLLRQLKMEFRKLINHLQLLVLTEEIYQQQLKSVKQLSQSFQNQLKNGNVSKGEFIRLKALELDISKNIHDLKKEINETQKELKLFMRMPPASYLQISHEDFLKNSVQMESLNAEDLLTQAKLHRPDYKEARLDKSYYKKLQDFEKAQQIPDITLKAGYDRGGNFMYNFVGFGIVMDLPLFNRNQGNIQYAKIGMERAGLLFEHMDLSIENEIILAYQNLQNAIDFQTQIEKDYEDTLDELLINYTKSFSDRNISLLEYLDFFETFLENKKIILEAGKEVNDRIEELNYAAGKDVVN